MPLPVRAFSPLGFGLALLATLGLVACQPRSPAPDAPGAYAPAPVLSAPPTKVIGTASVIPGANDAAVSPAPAAPEVPKTAAVPAYYSTPSPLTADPNGIDRVYMGRQIAHVMGHEGADWLERPGRESEEGTDRLVRMLDLKPTDTVADIGAGTGFLSFPIAARLNKGGGVMAVDLQPEMLKEIQDRANQLKVSNVQLVLGTESSPRLPPGSVDLALIVDAYHEFAYPREMAEGIYAGLKPGGRLALVEYRAEDPHVAIKAVHKMTVEQARKELEAVGFKFLETKEGLPQQHLIEFEKPRAK